MTTDCCPTCGSTRTATDRGPGWVVWLCPIDGIAREEVVGDAG